MGIETLALNLFLQELPCGKKELSRIWVSYDIPRDGGGAFQVGNVMESDRIISAKIVKELGEICFPELFTEIVFHNGSKDGVKSYNGNNDEILIHKLPIEKYVQIVSFVRSQRPKIYYQPRVLECLS